MTCLTVLGCFMLSGAAYGQTLIQGISPNGPVHLLAGDAAILDSPESRSDLACTVKPVRPKIGFDLKYHSGYEVTIPLQELAGNRNGLTAVFRVLPDDKPEDPVYFSQNWAVPALPDDARGRGELQGTFLLGEGKYHVDWMVRDASGRVCSARWQIRAEPQGRYQQMVPGLARNSVQPEQGNLFTAEAPVTRDESQSLNVLILLHVAPESVSASRISESETLAVLSILRRIAQEPRIGSYSIVAFNLDRNTILYRRDDVQQLNFPELSDAFQQTHLGTVEITQLQDKENEANFLGGILEDAIGRRTPDAVIFVGSRTRLDLDRPRPAAKDLVDPGCPVFYLTYIPDVARNPWRDLIGTAVKGWKGSELIITKPPDLFKAWTEVMSHFPKEKRQPASSDATSATNPLFPRKL